MKEPTPRQLLGNLGEKRARDLYRDTGYEILAVNDPYHHLGELDFVARKGSLIAFVEVRTRSTSSGGHPLESVKPDKQRKILRSARLFLSRLDAVQTRDLEEIRFDVVSVVERRYGTVVTVVEGAFEDRTFW